jgi:hypothetical protein
LDDPVGQSTDAESAVSKRPEDDKFVATHSGNQIALLAQSAQDVGNMNQEPVPGPVPKSIIHRLEAVKIDTKDCKASPPFAEPRNPRFQLHFEVAAI